MSFSNRQNAKAGNRTAFFPEIGVAARLLMAPVAGTALWAALFSEELSTLGLTSSY
jgi:hypothetical protein